MHRLLVNSQNKAVIINPPYDAEIEYIRAINVNAYIDTGVECTGDLSIECRFAVHDNQNVPCAGGYANNDFWHQLIGYYAGSGVWNIATYRTTSTPNMTWNGFSANTYHTFKLDANTGAWYINGTQLGTITPLSSSLTTGRNYGLMARINSDGTISRRNSSFAWCKLSRNGVLLRDLIPVRVGQVGYMYDKVSGQLFGNAGTGSFTLGSDIVKDKRKALVTTFTKSYQYIRLSYLGSPQNASTNYAVNTQLTLTQNNIYGTVVYAYSATSGMESPNITHTVIGARGPGWVGGFIVYPSRFCMAGVDLRTGVSIPSYRTDFTTMTFSNENGLVTVSVKVGNQSPVTQSESINTSGSTQGTPVTLFALRIVDDIIDAGGFVIKEVKLYDGSMNNQVSYMYPVRNQDGSQYGFYDEIRDLFIPITGTGWIIGPDA